LWTNQKERLANLRQPFQLPSNLPNKFTKRVSTNYHPYKGLGGIGKDEHIFFYPPLVNERPKRLGLGAKQGTVHTEKTGLQPTFTPVGADQEKTREMQTPGGAPLAKNIRDIRLTYVIKSL
jgi:hypothetical protein